MTRIMFDYFILEFHPDHPRAEGEGWVPQQILVMEKYLERELSPDEDIRHLNGNVHDNRVENLKVITSYTSKTASIFDNQDAAKRLSKTFIPCKFQSECWKKIRAPRAREHKIYLPYICSYQSEGDIYKCGHYWKFLKAKENNEEYPKRKGE